MSFHFRQLQRIKSQPKYEFFKQNVPKWQWYLLSLIIASPLFYLLGKLFINFFFVSASGYVTFNTVVIRAPANSYVKQIFVHSGDRIKPGQILAKLTSPQIDHKIKLIKEEIKALKESRFQNKNTEIEYLRIMQQNTMQHIHESEQYLETLKKSRDRGIIDVFELNEANTQLHNSKIQLNDISRKIEENKRNYQLSIENNYDEKINQFQREVKQLNKLKELFTVKSEKSATVIDVSNNVDEYVLNGETLIKLTTNENLMIHAFLSPEHMTKVKMKQKVMITFPDKTKILGAIYYTPKFVGNLPGKPSAFNATKKDIVLLIKPLDPVPKKYQIYGIPVEVKI